MKKRTRMAHFLKKLLTSFRYWTSASILLSHGNPSTSYTVNLIQILTKLFLWSSLFLTYQGDKILGCIFAKVVHQHSRLVASREIVEVAFEKRPGLK